MYFTVHGFLALTVTDSPVWVGVSSGVGGLALVSFSLVAGVLADRYDRRKLVIGALCVHIVLASIVAALIFADRIELWHILVASFLDGVVTAIKVPSRMALTLDVAGRERLLSATAANLAAMTGVGIFVPILGGQIGERFDIAWAYVIMAGAFAIAVGFMIALGTVSKEETEVKESPFQAAKSGVRYVFTTPRVRLLVLMALTSEMFGWAHETMLPVMARDVLHIGLAGQGYLLSAGSIGALLATLVISARKDVENKGRMLLGGYFGFGFFLVLFALSPLLGLLPLTLLLLGFAYASVITYEAALSTLIQTTVPDHMRGRVLAFQIMTWGVTGSSGFHMGAISAALGAPVAIAAGGVVLMLNTARMIRKVSIFKTQSTEVASGD